MIEPLPAATPLLTMVRLTEAVTTEVQKRQCSPLETFFFTMRLQLWPVFQKVISEHCDSLKKLSDRPSGYFNKAPPTTDEFVMNASIKSAYMLPASLRPPADLQTLHQLIPIVGLADRTERRDHDIQQVSSWCHVYVSQTSTFV